MSARILIGPTQAPGHVNQALAVAARLRERGHTIWFHARPEFAESIAAAGLTLAPMEHALDTMLDATEEGRLAARTRILNLSRCHKERYFGARPPLAVRAARKLDRKLNRGRITAVATKFGDDFAQGNAATELMYIRPMVGLLRDYQAILERFPADVLLVDCCCLGAMALQELGGPPWATLGVVPLHHASAEVPPYNSGLPPATTRSLRAYYRACHWLWNNVMDRPARAALDRERAQVGLPPLPRSIPLSNYLISPFLHLQGTIPAFEYPRQALPPQIHFVGPFMPPRPADITLPSWWSDLDSARAVILVTQGTVHTDPNNLVLPTLRALADEDVLVIATTPRPDALEPIPANARVEPYIPYEVLMPRVDILVTNGGYTGVQMALAHGVPVIVAGTRGDELHNGMLVSWLGVGGSLWTNTPSSELIAQTVRRILHDATFRQNAQRLQAEYAQRDGPTMAAQLIEQLARTGRMVTAHTLTDSHAPGDGLTRAR